MNIPAFLISVFGNLWIVRVAQTSVICLLATLAASIAFIFYASKRSKPSFYFFLISFLLLILIQFKSFELINLTDLSNDQVRVRDERLSAYPTNLLQIGYYLEAKPEVVAARRVFTSFFNELDPNIYFFAGHPREKVGAREFEKFPYILLPFFLVGLYEAAKNRKMILGLFIIPFLINALDKVQNNFALFPFFAVTIYLGICRLPKKFFSLFLIAYLLIVIQIISYEVY